MSARLACAVALAALALGCSSKKSDPDVAARALAEGLAAAVEVVLADPQPVLCAAWPNAPPPTTKVAHVLPDKTRFRRENHALIFEAGSRFAVVADARQPSSQLAATFAALRQQWESDGVVLVVALGGMGRSAEDLRPTLSALASPNWVLLVNPGDRESVRDVEALAREMSARLPVFATTAIRQVDIGGARLAILPGVAAESGLVAGPDGCLHRAQDADRMAQALAAHDGLRVWLSYAAPRQRGLGAAATDLSEGVHAGEPELAPAVAASTAQLVIHAQIAPPPATTASGRVSAEATATTPLAVGPLEDLPLALGNAAASLKGKSQHGGVVVTIGQDRLEWERTRRVAPVRR